MWVTAFGVTLRRHNAIVKWAAANDKEYRARHFRRSTSTSCWPALAVACMAWCYMATVSMSGFYSRNPTGEGYVQIDCVEFDPKAESKDIPCQFFSFDFAEMKMKRVFPIEIKSWQQLLAAVPAVKLGDIVNIKSGYTETS